MRITLRLKRLVSSQILHIHDECRVRRRFDWPHASRPGAFCLGSCYSHIYRCPSNSSQCRS
jgi:hypothetical protein